MVEYEKEGLERKKEEKKVFKSLDVKFDFRENGRERGEFKYKVPINWVILGMWR